MKKALPRSSSFSFSKKLVQATSLFLLIIFLVASQASAQQLQPSALRQIQSLMDEKASRTPAQKKISSRILYAYKMRNGQPLTTEVSTLRVSEVVKDAGGRIKVDIDAAVTAQLLNDLKALGSEIIFSSEKFGNIVAKIPLDKVEQVAALDAVKHIHYWMAPVHSSNLPGQLDNYKTISAADFDRIKIPLKRTDEPVFNIKYSPDFSTRGANVRKQLSSALKQMEYDDKNDFFSGSVTSQGDVTHKAALARTAFGTNGSGVKIGVLSDSYNSSGAASADIASGNLPGPGNPNGFTTPVTVLSDASGADEGRAMLQIIHDLSPGAQLYFATAFNSQADFAQQILDLRTAGCDIIVDDVTYFAEGVFQDDNVAQAVNTVTASGALYFSSAGNSGNKNDGTAGVWEGDFVDGGPVTLLAGGTVNNFGGTIYNVITANTGPVSLQWSDPLGLSGNDYDIFVTNSAGTSILDASTDIQDGNDNPFEIFGDSFTGERIYVLKKTGAAVRALHLDSNRGRLTFTTPGVTFGHNAAGSAYTVAATPVAAGAGSTGPYPGAFNSSNKVETFSSDGPRRIFYNPNGTEITAGNILFATNGGTVLQKPDITAADGVVTTLPGGSGLNPFYGTSAAAPHAAAIAALIKSKLPALTPAQIRTAITSSAIDIEGVGVDRDAGFGIIMAYEALTAAGATLCNLPTITAPTVTQPGCPTPAAGTIVVNATGSGTIEYSMNGGTYQTLNIFSGLAPGNYNISARIQGGDPTCVQNYSANPVVINPANTGLATISYTGPAAAIPDGNSAGVNVPLTVSGLGTSMTDIDFRLDAASTGTCDGTIGNTNASVDHTWIGDLVFKLTSPAGTTVTLISRPGGTGNSGNNFCTATLDDDGGFPSIQNVTIAQAPITGNFSPNSPLSAFDGQDPNGIWTLNVSDLVATDIGSVRRFSLVITTVIPCPNVPTITTTGTLTAFTSCSGSASAQQTFTVAGSNLTDNLTVTAPAGFEVSTSSGTGFGTSITPLVPSGGTVNTTTIYARMAATATGTPSGNIACASTGATTQNVAVSGTVNPLPSAISGPTSVCVGSTITLSNPTPGGTWSSNNSGQASVGLASGIVTGVAVGNPTITYTLPTGCFVTTTVTVNSTPAITINAPTMTQPTCLTGIGSIVVNATGSGTIEYSIDNGASWQLSSSFPNLNPGSYNIKARFQGGTCSLAYGSNPVVLNVPSCPGKTIPGRVEAENFDVKNGPQYAVATGDPQGGVQHVVGIVNGSWMDYNVFVTQTGMYNVTFRVATTQNNPQFQVKLGATLLGTVSIPNTGGWNTWQNITVNNIALTAGARTIRIQSVSNETCNFNWTDWVLAGANTAPTANAGPNQTVTNPPTTQVTLAGSGAANNGGTITSHVWSKFSGPAGGNITDPNNYGTTVTALQVGTYVFRLTVTDNAIQTATSDVTIVVNPASGKFIPGRIEAESFDAKNGPQYAVPTTDAGGGQHVAGLTNGSWLDYNVNVTQAGAYTVTFRVATTQNSAQFQVKQGASVLATVNIPNSSGWDNWINVPVTNVQLSGTGIQTLRIQLSSNESCNFNWMDWQLTGAATAPSITAGVDNPVITLPTNSVTLNGSGTANNGGSITNHVWTKFSGPAGETITNPGNYSTTVTGLAAGTYVFRLTVTQNDNQTATADVTVTVNPAGGGGPAGKTIPGKIEAEAWDAKNGPQYAVPTSDAGGGQQVIGMSNGSWLDYNVTVTQTGSYTVNFRVATTQNNVQFQVKLGATVLGTINISNTGGWDTWQTVALNNIALTAGPQTIRIQQSSNESCNFNWTNWVFGAPPFAPLTITVAKQPAKDDITQSGLHVAVHPNPASSYFNLEVQTKSKEIVTVRIIDIAGRQVQQLQGIPGQTIKFGDKIMNGTYLVEVRQGSERIVTKVVKQ